MSNRQNWLLGLYCCLTNAPVSLLGALWGTLYLVQAHSYTSINATYATSWLFIGMIAGSPLVGWISDHLKQRKLSMLVGSLYLAVITLPLAGISFLHETDPTILFFLLGICASIQVIGYSYVIELNSKTLASTAMGFVSVVLFIGSASLQPIFGWLMELHWNGLVENQVPIYTPANYQFALKILPIAAIMSVIIAVLLPKVAKKSNMVASIDKKEGIRQ